VTDGGQPWRESSAVATSLFRRQGHLKIAAAFRLEGRHQTWVGQTSSVSLPYGHLVRSELFSVSRGNILPEPVLSGVHFCPGEETIKASASKVHTQIMLLLKHSNPLWSKMSFRNVFLFFFSH